MTSDFDFSGNDAWTKIKVIGRGGSSTVYEAEIPAKNMFVAAKEIQVDGLMKDQVLAIEAEVETMKSLKHENIVNYLGTQRQESTFYIFLEYADRGSLRQFYQRHGPLTENQTAFCTKQILRGLVYLHSNGIAHRDIKGANVLLTKQGEMKLADFGASKRTDSASIVSGLKGTPHWMAPEVIKGTQMTTGWMKADVWSLGCTVVEMVTGTLPFAEYENPMTAMYHIANGKSPPLTDVTVSDELRSFVAACCCVDPPCRPTVEELLEFPFVRDCLESSDCLVISDEDETASLQSASVSPSKEAREGGGGGRCVFSGGDSPPPSPPPSPPSIHHTLSQETSAAVKAMTASTSTTDQGATDQAATIKPSSSKPNLGIKIDTQAAQYKPNKDATDSNLQNQETPSMLRTRKTRIPVRGKPSDTDTHAEGGISQTKRPPAPARISTLLVEDNAMAPGSDTSTPPASHQPPSEVRHTRPVPPKDTKAPNSTGRPRMGAATIKTEKVGGKPPPSPSVHTSSRPLGEDTATATTTTAPSVSSRACTAVATRGGIDSPLMGSPARVSNRKTVSVADTPTVTVIAEGQTVSVPTSGDQTEMSIRGMSTTTEREVVQPPVFAMWSEGDDDDAYDGPDDEFRLSEDMPTLPGKEANGAEEKSRELEDSAGENEPPLVHSGSVTDLSRPLDLPVTVPGPVSPTILQQKLENLSKSQESDKVLPSGSEVVSGTDNTAVTGKDNAVEENSSTKSEKKKKKKNKQASAGVTPTAIGARGDGDGGSAGMEMSSDMDNSSGEKMVFEGSVAAVMELSASGRPIAPLSSDKLQVYANLSGQSESSIIKKKQKASSVIPPPIVSSKDKAKLSHNNFPHMANGTSLYHRNDSFSSAGSNKSNGSLHKHTLSHHKHHLNSRPLQKVRVKKGSKVRSKSANVGGSSKLVLPPMEHGARSVTVGGMGEGLSGGGLGGDGKSSPYVPQLPLRMIQSAPTVSRSVNLPPILASKTPNKSLQSASAGQNPFVGKGAGGGGKKGGGSNKDSVRGGRGKGDTLHEEKEWEDPNAGGLLAPRGRG